MSAERSRLAVARRLAAALLLLTAAGQPGAALDRIDAQTESSLSSAQPINPGDIAVGSDHNLWFPETGTNRISRMTTTGDVREFTIPDAEALGRAVARDPTGGSG